METIKTKKDLPDWFDLKNYDCLVGLSNDELKWQLDARISVINLLKRYPNENSRQKDMILLKNLPEYQILKEMNNTSPLISSEHQTCKTQGKILDVWLAKTGSISGIKASTVSLINKRQKAIELKWKEDYIESQRDLGLSEQDKKIHANIYFLAQDYNILAKNSDDETICKSLLLDIDIKKYTDKEIISDLAKLLPIWREQLSIEEPQDIKYAKKSDLKKILHYKIIPLADLYIWCKNYNVQIPHRVYAGVLFPDFSRGEVEFKQTIFPFFKKLVSDEYRILS